ncbi:MAG TPA: hypothetical protein VL200_17005 [Lacunisphaera sp.]|jgi:uncharacterized membrane protein|nr:hypothetical protein [Lacunisphaera sp.]
MSFGPIPWARVHGASTHFPLVLGLAALACDLAAVWRWNHPEAPGLRSAGLGAITLAAAGALVAAGSGLFLTKGDLWGSGTLGLHHRFAWPALAMIVGAAVWRWLARSRLSRARLARYTAGVWVGSMLVVLAAMYGGELLQAAQ